MTLQYSNIMRKFSLAVDGEAGLLAIGCFQFTPHVLLSCSPPLVEAWFHLARPLPCHTLVHWFALPYLALHELITVYLSYWAAPSHSLIFELMIEHFLVPSTSHVSLHHLFLKKIYSLFWLYTDNLLNKIIS